MNAKISSLSLKNVRCFDSEQRATLSKVTLLVGENSAGKSTFLGCLNCLVNLVNFKDLSDKRNYFDQAPFSMGSFDNIVRTGHPSFRVGVGIEDSLIRGLEIEFEAGQGTIPQEKILELELADEPTRSAATLTITSEVLGDKIEQWCFEGPGFEFKVDHSFVSYGQFTTWLSNSVPQDSLPFSGEVARFKKRMGGVTDEELVAFSKFINFFRHRIRIPETPILHNALDPQGFGRERFYPSDPLGIVDESAKSIAISNIGQDLGLFSQLNVREHDPDRYEVLANVSGKMFNLVDIGYGVNSLLPFISDLVSAPDGTLFLLQQPEVHVHPSAQAKLVDLIAKSSHRFVIETHSDHIIDWFRILVTEGHLAASDFGIVYFEQRSNDPSVTQIYQLSLDNNGNLSGQPRNYRQFFSEETSRLLGLHT